MNVGLIGLDTSHVPAFAKLINDPADPHHLPGFRVTVGFPGPPSDFRHSHERVGKFTEQVRIEFGVKIVDSAEEVARQADLVLITAVDGRQHRELFAEIAPLAKPTFIDKPLATSLADATWIVRTAQQKGIPLMCSSALRYADNFQQALAGPKPVVGIDVFGPMTEEVALPGLFWYGVHSVEMVVAAMGAGCRSLRATRTDSTDLICLQYADGRSAFIRGLRGAHGVFGASIHRADGVQQVDVNANARPYYAGLMEAVLTRLAKGQMPVPAEQMLEVVAIMESANRSRSTGQEVSL